MTDLKSYTQRTELENKGVKKQGKNLWLKEEMCPNKQTGHVIRTWKVSLDVDSFEGNWNWKPRQSIRHMALGATEGSGGCGLRLSIIPCVSLDQTYGEFFPILYPM